MKAFFLNIISSFIGVFLASIALGFVSIILLIGLIVGAMESFEKNADFQALKKNSVLIMRLGYSAPEKTSDDPFEHYDFNTLESRTVLGLDDIVESIRLASADSNIEGIYLNIFPESQGWANAESLRQALLNFKASGKWVIAYNEIYTHNSYYISSVADKVYLNPEGQLQFQGLSAQSLFLKNTLEKLEIDMQVVRGPENEFKSAIETYTQDRMSERSRYQTQILIGELWDHFLNEIANSRGVSKHDLNQAAQTLAINLPSDALGYQLVDELLYQDQVRSAVKERLGLTEIDEISSISIEDYATQDKSKSVFNDITGPGQENQIAVVYADGEIYSGENDDGVVGSSSTSNAIRKARANSFVKAMVLRVNSPGGSALAAEVILREVFLFAQEKPVVVSFGNVAASGGYYIAAAGHKIYAEPNTITGSIGVFGLMPNLKGLMENKLGLNIDQVSTNDYADFGTVARPLKEFEILQLQKQVEAAYITFKSHVAIGRSLSDEHVEDIAKGRVWSGVAAKDVGLVDELGGLESAISEAALMAELGEYKLLKLPQEDTPFKRFLQNTDENARAWILQGVLGGKLMKEFSPLLKHVQQVQATPVAKGVQAQLPFTLVIN